MLPQSQIAVTFEHMQTAADSARSTATYIDDQLSDLIKVVNPIVATWSGTAAEYFQYQHQLWVQAATDLHSVLSQIAVVLANSHDDYYGTESAIEQKWSGG
ncbi:MAG TPA: WXG100 family type VII secretion target [Actinocrinis sp.]|nr:WXG100 family type VII secretion target [Actinocrinis sp.]